LTRHLGGDLTNHKRKGNPIKTTQSCIAGMETPIRVTRAVLVSEVKENLDVSNKGKIKKKVKFEDVINVGLQCENSLNTSNVTNVGIDISLPPLVVNILKPRHPLPDSWTFWYSAGDRRLSWKMNQKRISMVNTIEDFWFTYNQVKLVRSLPVGFTYSVFRTGILPDRDDPANRNGGKWVASFQEEERYQIDDTWLEVLDMLIGDVGIGPSKFITGAEACARKKSDKVELWVRNMNMENVLKVGRIFKERVNAGDTDSVYLSMHMEEKDGEKGLKLKL